MPRFKDRETLEIGKCEKGTQNVFQRGGRLASGPGLLSLRPAAVPDRAGPPCAGRSPS